MTLNFSVIRLNHFVLYNFKSYNNSNMNLTTFKHTKMVKFKGIL